MSSGMEDLKILATKPPAVVLADSRMPGMSGMQLLECVRTQYPQLASLMVTGVDDI